MASIVGIIILLMLLGGFAGLIVLQVKLSRKEATMPGLILPIISFVLALVFTVLLMLFMYNTSSMTSESATVGYYDEEGNFVVEEEMTEYYESTEEYEETMTVGIAVLPVLVIHLTPTIVFLIIYFACHPTKKKLAKKAELDKMSISDL